MPKKILLADDSITIQKVVELTFSDGDYEVTPVNNGAKAIQKLAEMRPDIILSDIIMPEKNGYEVCEYVKSHPEYRNIPVILLTGTFEPFDPDRADKAGCDAVVTKPFESQSLIHKVDELIDHSRASAAAAAPAADASANSPAEKAAPSPWLEDTPTEKTPSPFASPAPAAAAPGTPEDPFKQAHDIFSTPPMTPGATAEMPFGSSEPTAFSGETRAFQQPAFEQPAAPQQSAPPSQPEAPSPWDDQGTTAAFGGETKAFPKFSFDDLPVESPAAQEESPFGAPPPADAFSGETRAIPKLSLEQLRELAGPSASSSPAPTPDPAPRPAAEPAAPSTTSPWDEQPPSAFAGETRAFPKMSFEDLAASAAASPAPGGSSLWDEPAPSAPAWSAPAAPAPEPEAEPQSAAPAWAPSQPEPEPAPAASSAGNGADLTDEQVDRIARRVVQIMSDQVVRNIAWEVIPDLAEMVVKERIRQLEAE